jgi:hypothetical protein
MKDLTGVPDGEKYKHLNWHAWPINLRAEPLPFDAIATKRAVLFHRKDGDLSWLDAVKTAGVIDTPDKLHKLASDAMMALVAEADVVIRGAITKRLGKNDWKLDELKGRLEIHFPSNMPGVESYCLDGLPLVTFCQIQSEGSGTQIRAYRQFKVYDLQPAVDTQPV